MNGVICMARKAAASVPVAAPVVYIGPTVRGTLLRTFTIFADGVPEAYQDDSAIRNLFVAPDALDAARQEVGKPGSRLRFFYEQAEAKLKGGN